MYTCECVCVRAYFFVAGVTQPCKNYIYLLPLLFNEETFFIECARCKMFLLNVIWEIFSGNVFHFIQYA